MDTQTVDQVTDQTAEVDPWEQDFSDTITYRVVRNRGTGDWNVYRVRTVANGLGERVEQSDFRATFTHRIQASDYLNAR